MGTQMQDMRLKNMTDVCTSCPYLAQYLAGEIDVEEARRNCGYRCQQRKETEFIYKFDIVYSLYQHKKRKEFKGRVGKAEERYGKAARTLHSDGKSVADIAGILNLSESEYRTV